ncbi:MAG: DUF4294 domain-containing protein [Flavobacteriaceae bacterium]|jgi:hypothetical protein|nr:DUF4294 domain-containing protein [Flavobacteriaceae bacterium]
MIFKKTLSVSLLFFGLWMFAQKDTIALKSLSQYPQEDLRVDEYGQKYYYDQKQRARIYEINGETVVVLDELVLLAKPKFNNELDRNYYYFLNKKLYRVYPLFLKALEQYREIQEESKNMKGNERRKYVKERQKELADQYEKQLKDLTTTEGKVFAKLMNRATGKTVYEIIKELRGGWSAFWWNVKGNMADVSLKEPYNPHKNRTDQFLESLLQSNWNFGYLQPYEGFQDFKVSK